MLRVSLYGIIDEFGFLTFLRGSNPTPKPSFSDPKPSFIITSEGVVLSQWEG